MKTFVLVMQKSDAHYTAALYADDVANEPLAVQTFEASVKDLAKRFREASGRDALLALGQELYDLMSTALAPYMQARAAEESARLLFNIRDETLNTLPWELMVDDNKALFRNPSFPICRLQSTEQNGLVPLNEGDWPLRVLIVVASQKDDPRVAAEEEVAQIVDAIVPHEAAVDWELIVRPQREALLKKVELFKPHIFHFIGHGGISHGKPVLKLFDEQTNTDFNWDVITLRDDLTGKVGMLRLAFINACRTSQVAENGLWTVTDAFLDAGATAVVGTRAEITGTAAARCAGAFYRELFEDLTIDVAMARARTQMGEIGQRDWATPSLELRLPPLDLFSSGVTLHAQAGEIKRLFWQVCKYVGRQDVYRQAWQARLAEKKRLAVIKGAPAVGKTAAAEMLLERCLLADHVARYIDLKGQARGFDYVALMKATLEGNPDPFSPQPHTEPFPSEALDAFNVLLPEVLGVALDKRQDENVRKLFDGFRKIVEDTYPNRPILLAYDHLDGMETTALMKTIAQFARWLREASRVHTLLIIGNQKDQELLDNHTPVGEPHFNVMTVQLFDPKQYKDLSSEFVRRLLIARHVRSDQPLDEQAYEEYKAQALPLVWNAPVQGHWPPTLLANFEHILSLLNLLPGG